MTQLAIKTLDNDDVGVIEASDSIFAVQPRSDVLARIVRWQLAKKRQGLVIRQSHVPNYVEEKRNLGDKKEQGAPDKAV